MMKKDESSYRVRFITRRSNNPLADALDGAIGASVDDTVSETHVQTFVKSTGVDDKPTNISSPSVNSINIETDDLSLQSAASSIRGNPYFNARKSPKFAFESPNSELDKTLLEMEGQGVLIYEHGTSEPSHVSKMSLWVTIFANNTSSPCGYYAHTPLQKH